MFEREVRPRKETLFLPGWPVKESVPLVTACSQLACLWRCLAGRTHLPLTFRPLRRWMNARLTRAGSFNPNENVVPTGNLPLATGLAVLLPRAHIE